MSFLWGSVACGQQLSEETIRFFAVPTMPQHVHGVHRIPIDTGGVVHPKDTLFQLLSAGGNPISYYRKIKTEVCFDGSCRLLRIDLYWNVTGRYLGFELPSKEFLSKAEHTPFDKHEYLQLHDILADSLSPVGNLSYQNLIVGNYADAKVDGVTRPTSKDVLPYVVKGAVFTTYTMWNLIYGSTQADIEQATETVLTPRLLLDILNSTDTWDRYWALDRLGILPKISQDVQNSVLNFVCDDTYNLAARAIAAIPQHWCDDTAFQQALWSTFDSVQYVLRPKLIGKLSMCKKIDRSVLLGIAERLSRMNGPVLTAGLACLRNYLPDDPVIREHVTAMLHHQNPYIVNQVKRFLQEAVEND